MGADHDTYSRENTNATASLLAWLSSARGKVADVAERAHSATDQTSRGAATYLARFPYETVAIAVALGFVVGMLWSHRRP